MSAEVSKPITGRRTVCDHCRRRRIRCDGEFPCNQCDNASLTCKREHVHRRRGPKRGSGRVIDELRAQVGDEMTASESVVSSDSGGNQSARPESKDPWINEGVDASSSSELPRWHSIAEEGDIAPSHQSNRVFTGDQSKPKSSGYFDLIPTCIDLFYEHIYPIMPLIYMPILLATISRPMKMFEKNLVYALCALTSTHMSGKSIPARGPQWEAVGRFFLDECISIRHSYDFIEDRTLWAVISSYLVHTAFFEINQKRKSWYYLREAMTMGQDLELHDEKSYAALGTAEQICRRRTFWILYVTERSYAILRHKPLTLSKTPAFPSDVHEYEKPEIHSGFMHLVHSYHLLDSSFVDTWNEASSTPISTQTYTALQKHLNVPPPTHLTMTSIQKADILITQQWLRLIVWQSSMRQGLLSSTAPHESMTFRYPLKIAHALLSIISSLPTTSIEVHGMGIFEKIFEVGNTMFDVVQACGRTTPHDRYGVVQDPLALFVKTLSQSPNSQRQYASLLLARASERSEIQRFSNMLGPALSYPDIFASGLGSTRFDRSMTPTSTRQWTGGFVGEIDEDFEAETGVQDFVEIPRSDITSWVPSTSVGSVTVPHSGSPDQSSESQSQNQM